MNYGGGVPVIFPLDQSIDLLLVNGHAIHYG